MNIRKVDKILILIVLLGFVSIILANSTYQGPLVTNTSHVLDVVVTFLFISLYFAELFRAKQKLQYLRSNIFETLFVLAFIGVLIYAKYRYFYVNPYAGHNFPTKIILILSVFNIVRVLARIKKLNSYIQTLLTHPAQTIMYSFVLVILVGTILLMMPYSTSDHSRMGFINALFTATSATCVTGLIVVDTATKFSLLGKLVIMTLIQVGALGIMILGFFVAFLIGKKISYEERQAMAYMLELEKKDARKLAWGIKNIILVTFIFEITGALLMFFSFHHVLGFNLKNAFYSIFHAVSAFCNAGFALFSDNLAQFGSSVSMNFIIAVLIIAGGLSFVVILNSFGNVKTSFERKFLNRNIPRQKLKLNTQIVLTATVILIVTGTFIIYWIEHKPNLLQYGLKTQYLMSFFQSVTLRTAGFNTMDISKLCPATYFIMMLFMFIGGASGSTAGGIKVNTLGVAWAYIRSVFTGREDVVLFKHSISKDLVNQAFLVILLSLTIVFSGTMLLVLFENKRFLQVAFEAFSAFGTVGLSTGITPTLTGAGKLTITLLMFIGRLGPMTIVAAVARKGEKYDIKYPESQVSIG